MDFIASHIMMITVVWTEATITMLNRGAVNKRWNYASMLVRKTPSERFPDKRSPAITRRFISSIYPPVSAFGTIEINQA
jgi:hypothetical protein